MSLAEVKELAQTSTDLSEIIAENFGANATYVEGLLGRFRSNPELVDESWRAYFTELLGDGAGNEAAATSTQSTDNGARETGAAKAPARVAEATAPAKTKAAPATKPAAVPTSEQVEAVPIRGAALKIVENMDASLAVPTATTQRRIPVKLLDENRRMINQYLQENDRGKVSYTHLIAWALLRALDEFPQLNDGYEVVEGAPARVRRAQINLG
ncbi:MAG TPA: 2-oxo acid dehydrogenase subunit E2, partial [Pyrinomonadaceae bacterium]